MDLLLAQNILDTEFLKYLGSQSFGMVLAYIFFKAYQRKVEEVIEEKKERIVEEEQRANILLKALMDNTAAITRNTSVVDSFHRRIDTERGERT